MHVIIVTHVFQALLLQYDYTNIPRDLMGVVDSMVLPVCEVFLLNHLLPA